MKRSVKKEKRGDRAGEEAEPVRTKVARNGPADGELDQPSLQQDATKRRVLRSKYLVVKSKINDSRDEISNVDSNKFNAIIDEVEHLHQQVSKPREQIADAEALFDIANTLAVSAKSISCEGISLAEYVNCLVREFGKSSRNCDTQENELISMNWKAIGMAVSPAFETFKGICTMLGPMKNTLKERKPIVSRRRSARPTHTARPEEVDDAGAKEQTDTDKNMASMFEILRQKRRVKLESLILNRSSFAQSVENLFALSFLVKDGRAEIVVDESGSHIVSPKNAPGSGSVLSREVVYDHFVFRFDFNDWKLMMNVVPVGEELMPNREGSKNNLMKNMVPAGEELMPHREDSQSSVSRAEPTVSNSEVLTTTPIRKLSRNLGLVLQESIVEDSPEMKDAKGPAIRRCRRRLN